jgi:hypothetical protein
MGNDDGVFSDQSQNSTEGPEETIVAKPKDKVTGRKTKLDRVLGNGAV